MKLVVAIVQDEDAAVAVEELVAASLPVTCVPSKGGFIGAGNTTLLMALDEGRLEEAAGIISRVCKRRVPQGSHGQALVEPAVMFWLRVDGFITL